MEYDRVIQTRLTAMARERYLDCDKIDFFSMLSTEQTEITRSIMATANAYTRNQRQGEFNGNQQSGNDNNGAIRSDAAREKAPGPPAVIPKEGFPPKIGNYGRFWAMKNKKWYFKNKRVLCTGQNQNWRKNFLYLTGHLLFFDEIGVHP